MTYEQAWHLLRSRLERALEDVQEMSLALDYMNEYEREVS